jgi:hypothetical protein
VSDYSIFNKDKTIVYTTVDNHQTINKIVFKAPVTTDLLHLQLKHPDKAPAAVYQVLFS